MRSKSRLRLTVDPAALRLTRGRFRWAVQARQRAECTPGTTATAPAPADPSNGAPAEALPPCDDFVPDTGAFRGHFHAVALTGCVASGPSFVTHGPRSRKWVALTFDDGPAFRTPAFLATLSRLNVPATFFLVGQNVLSSQSVVRRMVADGHMVAGHSWTHANLGGGGPAASTHIRRTTDLIRKTTGFAPCVWRAPYGSVGPDLIARARALGQLTIQWDVDPRDWTRPGSASIAARVVTMSRPGSIVVMHDGGGDRAQTLAAVPDIVRRLQARGYQFVTVSEMLELKERFRLVR